jgi:hypothetical protein
MANYNQELTEKIILNDDYSTPQNVTVLAYDSANSRWTEIEGVQYFKITKRLNQMSLFEIDVPEILNDQKLYIKEFAKVMLFSGNILVLKGRIQKVSYQTAYAAHLEGYGMEATILDKEYSNATRSPEDPERVQYDNESAQLIAKELLSINSDGMAPWIMQPRSSGIFSSDYGLISMRFEYANVLSSLGNLAKVLNYDWWIDHDPISYENDYFNLASIKGNQTDPSGDLSRQFTITGANQNADGTDYQRDITNLSNYMKMQGYGDGINQISTETYNASPIYTLLFANISDTDTTISLLDASAFAASGEVRIAMERVTYSGKSGNDLTGCSRGANGTIAKPHRKGCYTEKYVAYDAPEPNSSLYMNGLMEMTLTNRDIRDESTLELIASNELLNRMTIIERITIQPSSPDDVAQTIQTGDLVSVIDAESSLNSNYRVVGIVYENNYGNLDITLELSNKSLTFIEQMQKEREANQALQKIMQGSTNIYCLPFAENIDSSHPGYIRFYLPAETIALNHVKLNFKMKNYRADSTSITAAPAFKQRMSMWHSIGEAFMKGNFSTTDNVVHDLSFTQKSNCVSDLSVTYSSQYYPRFTGSWHTYDPDDFVEDINGDGTVNSWWSVSSGQDFISADSWSNSTMPTGFSWTNNSLVNGWSFNYSDNFVNGWTNWTWNDPIHTSATAPSLSGTFDKIKVTATVHNGYNETKTPTINLYRGGTLIATYSPSISSFSSYFIDYEDTTDYMGSSYKIEIPLTGFDVNHTTGPDSSYVMLNVTSYVKTPDTIVFGIYENSGEFTPPGTIIIKAGVEGSESAVGTYTSNQDDLEITNSIPNTPGAWYVVKFDSNHANNSSFGGRMRLEANLYVQMFIESK